MTRDQLITEHLHLTKAVASRLMGRRHAADPIMEDAIGVGTVALCQAADKYDPESGASFATYAWTAIENAINLHRARQKRVYDHETKALNDVSVNVKDPDSANLLLECVLDARHELAPSPEDLLILAEERARGEARMARLSPESRERVEALLADKAQAPLDWKRVAREAGVRVSKKDAPAPREALTRKERGTRYYQRNYAAVRERQNAWARAKRAAARAAKVTA